MNTKYFDLINQTYYFPQEEFTLNKDNLQFHNIDLMKLVEKYGTIILSKAGDRAELSFWAGG